jgi:transposase
MKEGHQFIRLPPYHCQYTPIELVWAQVKLEVPKKKRICKISDVERLVDDELDKVTQADWASCEHHAVKLHEDDYAKDDMTKF